MKRYGLIGRTLTHSFSKKYFEDKFRKNGITDCTYENFELRTIGEFPSLLSANPELKGLNVTIPYKEEIISYLDKVDDMVQEIRACNCIHINDGQSTGYNTDAIAFRKTLEPKLKSHHLKALILGSGGASKAIQYALKQLRLEYIVVSRSRHAGKIGYEDLDEEILGGHKVIINTTPLGMYPAVNACPPIPYRFLTSGHLLYDVVYNPEKTVFLKEGEKRGAEVLNGFDMLVLQAEESWRIWNQ